MVARMPGQGLVSDAVQSGTTMSLGILASLLENSGNISGKP